MKEDMKDARSASQTMQRVTGMPIPLTAWWSGFDYVFGYQLKLVQEFRGFSPED